MTACHGHQREIPSALPALWWQTRYETGLRPNADLPIDEANKASGAILNPLCARRNLREAFAVQVEMQDA